MEGEAGDFLYLILVLLGTSTLLITLFNRLRITPLLAFLLVGLVFGPTGLGLVPDAEELAAIGELGLTFLLFILGLEFSVARLYALRRTVFVLGGAQVGICTAVFFLAFYWWGLPWAVALILAGGLSLSSTAIVSAELGRLGRLTARYGEISIGILLFQDLAAVILLIGVDLAARPQAGISLPQVGLALLESALLLAAFFLAGRYLLPRLLMEIIRQKSDELLVLCAVVIVLLASTLTHSIGLSMELGAFLAGMMLGDTRFRHQLEADLRPFRDLLLGLFFITIGMLIDVGMLASYWPRILLAGLALMLFKGAIISLVARLTGESWRDALPAGLALAQGGEFLFALLALATRGGLLSLEVASFLVSMTIVSMLFTPFLVARGPAWSEALLQRFAPPAPAQPGHPGLPAAAGEAKRGHVLILGFGRVGQVVARYLRPLDVDYLVLETNHMRIAQAAAAGEPVYYGDAARVDILKAAGAQRAAVVVASFDDPDTTARILQHMAQLNPDTPVLARTRDDAHLERLLGLGAAAVIPETHEASLTLVSHLLLMLKLPTRHVLGLVEQARRERYRMLQDAYDSDGSK